MPKGSKTTARIAPLYVRSVEYCAPFPEHRVKAGRRLGAPATPSRHPGEIAYSADSSPGLRPFTSIRKLLGFLNNLLLRLTFRPTVSASSITKWTQLRLFRQIGRASCREKCVSTCRSRWLPYH